MMFLVRCKLKLEDNGKQRLVHSPAGHDRKCSGEASVRLSKIVALDLQAVTAMSHGVTGSSRSLSRVTRSPSSLVPFGG